MTSKEKILDYAKIRNRFKNGDVLLYQGKGLFSRLIKKITQSKYSHSGIVIWWNNRLMVMEARAKKGVIVSPLSRSICGYHGQVEWYTSIKPISKKNRKKMVEFAELELGKQYQTGLVLFNLVGKLFGISGLGSTDTLGENKKQYCSYYVAQIYNAVGLDLVPHKNDCFTAPDDIAKSKKLRLIGLINRGSDAAHAKNGPCYKYKTRNAAAPGPKHIKMK